MRVYRRVSSRSCQVFVVLVRNVRSISCLVLLCQPEIYHENYAWFLLFPYQKIVRLYVSMQKPLVMNVLDSLQNLQTDHYRCLNRKRLSVLLEQRLQRIPQWFHHHYVFLAFCEVLVNLSQIKGTLRMPRSLAFPSPSRSWRILAS